MSEDTDDLLVAFATSDGISIPKGHFGEAPRFEIYRLSATSAIKVDSVGSPHADGDRGGESRGHHHHGPGGGQKGAGIGRLLGTHGVQVMVARAFGPNVKRMRQRFLPVKIDLEQVMDAIALLQHHWDRVQEHWSQGEGRKHLVLRNGP
jgi:predicted Fe-Mo cluster-binding NifX family protein